MAVYCFSLLHIGAIIDAWFLVPSTAPTGRGKSRGTAGCRLISYSCTIAGTDFALHHHYRPPLLHRLGRHCRYGELPPFNPRPDGVLLDPARRWEGTVSLSPPPSSLLSAKLLDGFSIRRRYLIAPGLNFPNMLQNFIRASLMTSQVGSKVRFLTIYHCWLRRAKQPYQVEIKPIERHTSCLLYF